MAPQLRGVGIDMATWGVHVGGMDDPGAVVLRKRLARSDLRALMAHGPPLRRGMDACGSAHDGARCVGAQGHDGRWTAPHFINASVKAPKHEARAAEARCEAVTRPTRRFVPITRVEPQDLRALPRLRERRIKARTAVVHALRGRLSEDGMALPQSLPKLRALMVPKRRNAPAQLTALSTAVFWRLSAALLNRERRLAAVDAKRAAIGRAHPAGHRRQPMPGLGPSRATAIPAAISAATQVKHGRQVAAWRGLVPRPHPTAGTPRRRGISNRGARSRRQRCVPGARATRRRVDAKQAERRRWRPALIGRRGRNRAAGARAHQNARMAWALRAPNHESRVKTAV
jgi:transposase